MDKRWHGRLGQDSAYVWFRPDWNSWTIGYAIGSGRIGSYTTAPSFDEAVELLKKKGYVGS